jgi:hypothetical protein
MEDEVHQPDRPVLLVHHHQPDQFLAHAQPGEAGIAHLVRHVGPLEPAIAGEQLFPCGVVARFEAADGGHAVSGRC